MLAAAIAGYAIWRRRSLRNADVLILLVVALGLALVAGTEIPDALLVAFSFERENGTRIVGVAIFAILILFLLVAPRARAGLADHAPARRRCSRGSPGRSSAPPGIPERFRDKIAILVPAYNEADNVGHVLDRLPTRGLRRRDRGAGRRRRLARRHRRGRRARTAPPSPATSSTAAAAPRCAPATACSPTRRREIVVTIDADGQHLPEEMARLVAAGARRRGRRSRTARGSSARPSPTTRRASSGIVFFNRVVSFITRTKVTDCSNGYRAVRADVLPQLVLRQEQFHTSEFMIEAIKRGIPAKEVPVTVVSRLSGHSKKPAVVRYGMGFANAIVRTWLR